MKKPYALYLILCFSLTVLSAAALQKIPDPDPNPGNLRTYCYIPDELDGSGQYPLVLVLHGSMLNARTMHRCGGWAAIADSMKFLLLYPEQRFVNNPVRAFNVLFGVRKSRLQREAESIRNMMTMMVESYAADPERIYVTGLSAGGSMANALLHIYPDLFRAGALIAAPSYLPREIIRKMPHIPRLAIIQGESDPVVPPNNATEILMEWMNKYPPGSLQRETEYPYLNNPDLRAQFFYHEDTLHIVRLDMAGVAHQMPVDPGAALPRGGRHTIYSVDIDFHLNWWIAGFFLSQSD